VYDQERLSLFAPDGRFVRSARIRGGALAFRFAVLSHGKVLLNNYYPTHKSFQLLSTTDSAVTSFGRSIVGQRFPDSDELQFRMVDVGNGEFVAVQQNYSYLVQVWDTTGRLVREFAPSTDWFRPWTRAERLAQGPGSTPFPSVQGAFVDQQSRALFVTAMVPDPGWRAKAAPQPDVIRGREVTNWSPLPLGDYVRAYDTVIDVLDYATGTVRFSQRLDEVVPFVMEGGILFGQREDANGLIVLDVWRLELRASR
jgi:hypothetical protein